MIYLGDERGFIGKWINARLAPDGQNLAIIEEYSLSI
jgi:hypothetical protein